MDKDNDDIVAGCRTSRGPFKHKSKNFPGKEKGGRKLSDRTPERNNNDSNVESCLA